MKRIALGVFFSFLAVFLSGCAWIDGDEGTSTFVYNGAMEDCVGKHFPTSFDQYETDEPFEGSARIMMYESIARRITDNYLAIQFAAYDGDTLEPCPTPSELVGGDPIAITVNGCVRAQFMINRCDPTIALRVIGTLTLDKYSIARKKRVSGTITGDLEQVTKMIQNDGHYEERITSYGSFSGEFSYLNHTGSVWNH